MEIATIGWRTRIDRALEFERRWSESGRHADKRHADKQSALRKFIQDMVIHQPARCVGHRHEACEIGLVGHTIAGWVRITLNRAVG
jgi:hypothetical protein